MDRNLKSSLRDIAKIYNLNLLVVFGSYATEDNSKNSDLDIAYISEKEISEKDLVYDIVKKTKIENIDLVEISNRTPIELKWEIMKKGVCIYENEKYLYIETFCNAYMDYVDFQENIKIKNDILNEDFKSINSEGYKKEIEL